MMPAIRRLLISGAGPAGQAFARALEQNTNIAFDIIEKRSRITPDGTGIALPANAVKAIEHLGLRRQLLDCSHQVTSIAYTASSGRVLSQRSLLTPPFDAAPFVALHRHQLNELLSQSINQPITLNTSISALRECDDGVVVTINGEEKQYDAVIGADGIHSGTRQLLYPDVELTDLGVSNWRWICEHPTDTLQPTYMLGTNTAFMAYPISDHEVYCYAHIPDPTGALDTSNQEAIIKHFSHFGGICRTLLDSLPDEKHIIPGRLRSVPRPFLAKGAVAFIGDASSACSPMLQQGAACGFEAAVILAELLKHFPPREAFRQYEHFYQDRVSWIIQASDTPLKGLVHTNRFKLFARDLMIYAKGPFNMVGWNTLLQEDPIAAVKCFLQEKCHTHAP